ncbi:MAG: hypothetical protein ACJ78Q_02890 [Chloroflexia bacterium]
MAKKDEVKTLQQKSKFAAMEGLRPTSRWPVSPRKAMAQARKSSKGRGYPVPPYPDANPLQLFRWGRSEWHSLGRAQKVALPVIIFTALTTWEKEDAIREERQFELDRASAKVYAARLFGAFGEPRRKRKLLGIIPLPGGKKQDY